MALLLFLRSRFGPRLPVFLASGRCWPIHAVEVAFESIDVSGPEPAERSQPRIHLLKWFRLQTIETALRIHRGFDETRVAQHTQALGHGRLRHAKLTLEFPHRLL